MDVIAPHLKINERRQAAASLAKLAEDDDWDDADKMAAASEVFRLVTGVPLAAEQRVDAAAGPLRRRRSDIRHRRQLRRRGNQRRHDR